MNTIPTRIFELSPDGLSQYEGGFDFYLEEKKRREEKRAQEAVAVRKEEQPSSYHRSRQERAEQVKRKQHFHQLETQIEEAEERIAALQTAVADSRNQGGITKSFPTSAQSLNRRKTVMRKFLQNGWSCRSSFNI